MRLPEIYYILAEVWYTKDQGKALDYRDAVRNSRGLTDIAVSRGNTQDKFMTEIAREWLREFYGEGQVFSFYKCRNLGSRDILDEKDIVLSRDIFVLSWPKSE